MADAARRLAYAPPALPPGAVLCPPATRFVLRGDDSVMQAAGHAIGALPSRTACRASRGNEWSALWQGPDEQLLLGPAGTLTHARTALAEALNSLPHSLVDVSHRQIGFELGGADASSLLASGCPLDLDLAAFPVDMATRTIYAKTEIVLWRLEPERFRVEVWRSYATYLLGLLVATSLQDSISDV